MRKIEPSRSSKQSACEHNPAGSPQIIQTPPYQTPDDDSANNVAEDGDPGVVSAVPAVRGYTGGRPGGFGGPGNIFPLLCSARGLSVARRRGRLRLSAVTLPLME